MQLQRELDGIPTEVLIQSYQDRLLVLVTQLGKVGNLIQVSLPATTPLEPQDNNDPAALPTPSPAIQLTPLLGNGPSEHLQTLHSLYASQIATIIWTTEAEMDLAFSRRSVIVGIALRKATSNEGLSDLERKVFSGVMAMVKELVGKK
ncbi:hypothetical protein C8J56DRAFT_262383 [Mycena floridula]|nr:hypothetical protein C8J56DRAFT_262383 [Mycena floridula]